MPATAFSWQPLNPIFWPLSSLDSMPDFELALRAYLVSFMTDHRRDLLPQILLHRTRHLTVVIEEIYSPHNASACLRSCDCFGIQDVHLIEDANEYLINDEIALGAAKWLTTHRYQDPVQCVDALRAQGYAIVVTSPHEPTCQLETYDIRRPTALVFGNEKSGVSPAVIERADHILRVPMFGFTESFNISVAAAICLHHLTWRLRETDIDWKLSSSEREALLTEWVKIATGTRLPSLQQRFGEIWSESSSWNDVRWPDWSSIGDSLVAERANRRATDGTAMLAESPENIASERKSRD